MVVLIIFPLTLQTVINVRMLTIGGRRVDRKTESEMTEAALDKLHIIMYKACMKKDLRITSSYL